MSEAKTITFKGRGHASRIQGRILLKVCPLCSQKNSPQAEPTGRCGWCAYVPDPRDIEIARPGTL
ncbi:hypothetical protein M446_3627 [Methylobacterium sp. 4-46]|uniref:hypothetical protein n=1 Tax=unclassified Methylobacterium TaxID=2615210 RepID=UPI000165C6B5|nr:MULTISPECIES: hypothetical protein [Methylobacterium]ACA18008.1 hypothetical protein M446_3627 [Methylobacterium sp. 4-46]WFT77309.1 hypothetical protein QA634_18380 [Methylobacterium nodulans]